MSWFDPIRKFFDYNRYTLICGVGVLVIGCTLLTPKVESVLVPGKQVDANGLNSEEQQMIAKFAAAKKTLQEKQDFLLKVQSLTTGLLEAYLPTPFSAFFGAAAVLLGLGATGDRVRISKVLNDYKDRNAVLTNTVANVQTSNRVGEANAVSTPGPIGFTPISPSTIARFGGTGEPAPILGQRREDGNSE